MYYETDGPHGLKHNPFKSLVVPRPIGWISSQDSEGRVNLAPFSFFNAVASDPPIVFFAANGTHSEGGAKDSLANVEATGGFVCNVATWETREAMNKSSASAPHGIDEFDLAGLTPIPSNLVKPPRVKESPVHLECRYLQTINLPATDPAQPNNIALGQVIAVHIDDSILKDGMIDMEKFHPIARLGYMDYTVVNKVFTMQRPDWP